VPLFVFLGDTNIKVFETHKEILESPYVIVECTFLEPEHANLSGERDHIHYEELKPIIESNPKTTFILIHFSLRKKDQQILEFFENKKT